MEIKELTADQFKEFNKTYNMHSIYQTPEYGFIMNHQNFEIMFLGLLDNGNI